MKSERSDDPLLRALANVLREEATDTLADPHLDAMAQGGAPPAAFDPGSPKDALLLEAFAPLGPDAEARFAKAALEALSSHPRSAKVEDAERASPSDAPERNVVPFIRRTPTASRKWKAALGAIALAATVALFFLTRHRGVSAPGNSLAENGPAQGAALPLYEWSLEAGARTLRGDDPKRPSSAPLTLTPGAPIVATLRPAVAVSGVTRAQMILVQAGRAIDLHATVYRSPDGAHRLRAKVPSTGLSAGQAVLWITVARPSAPAIVDGAKVGDLVDGEGRRAFHEPVVVELP